MLKIGNFRLRGEDGAGGTPAVPVPLRGFVEQSKSAAAVAGLVLLLTFGGPSAKAAQDKEGNGGNYLPGKLEFLGRTYDLDINFLGKAVTNFLAIIYFTTPIYRW